ncbi:MAG: outer membrane protein transport protein [Pseudomonadota bacterium]
MKKHLMTSAALAIAASAASAGGVDRSGQGVGVIFSETGASGGYAQFSFGNVNPTANGGFTLGGGLLPGEASPLGNYAQAGFAYKQQLTDALSLTLIYDQPFGAQVSYDSGAPFFGGFAEIESDAFTVLGRYELGNGLSVHGGVRALKLEGEIFTLFDGGANPALLSAESDFEFGGVLGVAYERPDIALRVALTYSSAIDVGFDGTESRLDPAGGPGGVPDPTAAATITADSAFDVEFPESINLDFQSGVAEDTLVFGTVRWVGWGGFNLTTDGAGLANLSTGLPGRGDSEYVNFEEDTVTYTLGVGRRLSDQLSVALSYTYEAEGNKPSTTALAPTTGLQSIGLSGSYALDGGVTISGGVTYGIPGDQIVENSVVDGGEVLFDDNEVIGVGIRVGFAF